MTTGHRLLAEDLLLLAWNDRTGKPHGSTSVQLPAAIGGALLLDLALRDRLRIEVDVPRASTRRTGDDLLDEVATQLRDGSTRRKLKGWIRRVGTAARRDQVRDRLVAQGLLVAEERRVLGFRSTTRHTLADPAAVEELADTVRHVLTGTQPTDDRATALAALTGATAILNQLLPQADRREARRRAKALAETSPVAAAARAVIRDTQAALATTYGAVAGATAGQ